MSDNASIAVVALAIAIAFGFMANCEKESRRSYHELEKAKIKQGVKP